MSLKSSNKFPYIFLSLLFLIGLWLRCYGISRENFAFTYDIGRDFLIVRDLVLFRKITFIGPTTGINGLFYGPWWYWILSIPFIIGNGDPKIVSYIFALIGTLLIPLGYLFIIKTDIKRNPFLPLIFGAIIAFSTINISQSDLIWNPHLVPLFLIGWLVSLIYFLKENKYAVIFLGIFSALILEHEASFGFFFLISSIISFILLSRKNIKYKSVLFYISGLLLIFWPRIVFDIRHSFLMSKNLLKLFSSGGLSSSKIGLTARFADRIVYFFNTWNQTVANNNQIIGITIFIISFTVIIFHFVKYQPIQKEIIKYISLITGLIYVFFSLYGGDFWSYYLVGFPIIFCLLVYFAFVGLNMLIPNNLFGFLTIVYLLFLLQPLKIIANFSQPNWEGDAAVYRNVKNSVEKVYQDANGEPFNYIAYTPPLIPYTYQYLFTWLSETKYHNLPSFENQKLLYVILEPDFDKPERQADWLIVHKNDGPIISEEKLSGGIELQKRIRPGF